MAVGKGSMERAAKAAEPSKTAKNTKGRKASENKAAEMPVAEASAAETPVVQAAVIAAPVVETEINEQIVYQKSSGMLERSAEPNEQFGLGDAMPVYYF